jgi:hypoxanthine phosphoribosyltransferase
MNPLKGTRYDFNGEKFELIVTMDEIKKWFTTVADQIKQKFHASSEPPIIIGVITGGLYTFVDLTRALQDKQMRYHVDTIGIKRYQENEKAGNPIIYKNPSANLLGRDIIVVEDVVDEGYTLDYIIRFLIINNPKSITVLALGWKSKATKINIKPDYYGFDLPIVWLIGEGMDNNQTERGLKGIWQKVS